MENKKYRIMIVDDETDILMATSRILKHAGFETIECDSGKNALNMVRQHMPDLIVLDFQLSDINGDEILWNIKNSNDLQHIMVLMLTGYKIKGTDKADAFDLGADGYLTRPVNDSELVARIKALLRLMEVNEELRRSRDDWNATFDAISNPVSIHSPDYSLIRANKAFTDLFGQEGVANQLKCYDMIHNSGQPHEDCPLAKSLECGEPTDCEIFDAGLNKHLKVHCQPQFDDNGAISHIVHVITDITEQKERERKLEDSLHRTERQKQELEALLKGAKAIIESHTFTDAAKSIFYTCTELIAATSGYVALLSDDGMENEVLFLESGGRPCDVNPELPMPIRGLRADAYNTGETVYHNDFMNSEWVKYMPNMHVVLDNVMFAPLNVDGKIMGIMGIANKPAPFTDHDARLAAVFGEFAGIALKQSWDEEKLTRSEEQFRTLVSNMPNSAVFLFDRELKIVKAEGGEIANMGFTSTHFEDRHISQSLDEKTFQTAQPHYQHALEGERSSVEFEFAGDHYNLITAPIRSGDDNIIGGIAFIYNITDLRQTEAQRDALMSELEQKNDELTQIIHTISHDLRTPMLNIRGFSQELRSASKEIYDLVEQSSENDQIIRSIREKIEDRTSESLSFITESVEKIDDLLNGLVRFADFGKDSLVIERIDMDSIIDEVLTSFEYIVKEHGVRVATEKLPICWADHNQIYHVFANLIGNAIKYRKPDCPATIAITGQLDNDQAVYHVRDNGIGIPPEQQDKVFGIFTQLDKSNDGQGLGLALTRKIVQGLGGHIWLDSKPGEGTVFHVSLPCHGQ